MSYTTSIEQIVDLGQCGEHEAEIIVRVKTNATNTAIEGLSLLGVSVEGIDILPLILHNDDFMTIVSERIHADFNETQAVRKAGSRHSDERSPL